jgi:hypothetical protein
MFGPTLALWRFANDFGKIWSGKMGEHGSGMWRVSRRPLAETMRRIDLATLRRDAPPLTARHTFQIKYYNTADEQVQVTTVYLESTRMYFGGRRLWFRCPRCEGRCRVLYGTWRIACRRCHRLRYCSQRETKEDRATRAMLKIVRRLNPDDPVPCPKSQRECTGIHTTGSSSAMKPTATNGG